MDNATIGNTLTEREQGVIKIDPSKRLISLTWADLYVIGKMLMISEQNDEYVSDLHMPAYAVMVLTERIKDNKLQLF